MSQTETNPISRRDIWLRIALAVAKDGLPEPDVSLGDGVQYHYVSLRFDRHSHARDWARWLGVEVHTYDRPDLDSRYVKCDANLHGWRLDVAAAEPIPVGDPDLAAQVAAAILTPDAAVTA